MTSYINGAPPPGYIDPMTRAMQATANQPAPSIRDQVMQTYQQMMGRAPAADTLDYFTNDLTSGRATMSDLHNTLNAFNAANPRPAPAPAQPGIAFGRQDGQPMPTGTPATSNGARPVSGTAIPIGQNPLSGRSYTMDDLATMPPQYAIGQNPLVLNAPSQQGLVARRDGQPIMPSTPESGGSPPNSLDWMNRAPSYAMGQNPLLQGMTALQHVLGGGAAGGISTGGLGRGASPSSYMSPEMEAYLAQTGPLTASDRQKLASGTGGGAYTPEQALQYLKDWRKPVEPGQSLSVGSVQDFMQGRGFSGSARAPSYAPTDDQFARSPGFWNAMSGQGRAKLPESLDQMDAQKGAPHPQGPQPIPNSWATSRWASGGGWGQK